MSRIGKKPVSVPSGVTANVEGQTVKVKGPKGALQLVLHDDVSVSMDKAAINVQPRSETKRARSQWGTARTLVNNLISGVTKGFEEKLEINGVGYRAAVQGKQLNLQLGYSHDINYPIPQGIAIATPKPTEIVITGVDKQQVGQVAAEIRAYRPPEPYKGKGVRYADERQPLLEALRDALHHVRDERAHRALHRARFLVCRLEQQRVAVALDGHRRRDGLRQRAERARHRNLPPAKRHVDLRGDGDRGVANA